MKFVISIMIFAAMAAAPIVVTAQSKATATASATIVLPLYIEATVLDVNIEKEANNETVRIFNTTTSKKASKSMLLPLVKKTITFASVTISDATSQIYDISFPASVVLKNKAETETVTAYSFKYLPGPPNASNTIYLTATLAIATDQNPDVYTSKPVDVVLNCN